MSDFQTFMQLGVRHIVDIGAMDHILFLLALAAIYRLSDWREILRVVTAFTVGHSITLAAAVLGFLPLSARVVEFLIPLTIVATCIENILVKNRSAALWHGHYRPVFATVFGLVHGAGFGGYLKSLFLDRIVVPLFGFNVGIEIGQLGVLAITFAAIAILDLVIRQTRIAETRMGPLRLRVVAVSTAVMIVAARWAAERSPW
jgi:HupE / UreJ protein